MSYDDRSYMKFCSRRNLDKALGTLGGLVSGITVDGKLGHAEVNAVRAWLSVHAEFADQHPFDEVIPKLVSVLEDGIVTEDERDDVLWLCNRILKGGGQYDEVTADLQHLQGMMAGAVADGVVTKEELEGLRSWMNEREYLAGTWPYEELQAIISGILEDGIVDDAEQAQLKAFFSEFIDTETKHVIGNPAFLKDGTLQGVCAVDPDVQFPGKVFCFTGESNRLTRARIEELVTRHGGLFAAGVSGRIDYLVIGANGNPCWAYACYGRKIEKAVELRKRGSKLLLIHELNFWGAATGVGEQIPPASEQAPKVRERAARKVKAKTDLDAIMAQMEAELGRLPTSQDELFAAFERYVTPKRGDDH
jgi:hypothetical protein